MSCENCEEAEKQEILIENFGTELSELLGKYREKLEPSEIAFGLILEAKIEMCCTCASFYEMLGIITNMLNFDVESMWKHINKEEDDLREKD